MSFLPYAPLQSGTWAAAISGSAVLHGGLAILLVTSSVTLLPNPADIALRTPDYEITLEIVDIPQIEPDDPRAIPDDAVPLEPVLETPQALEEITPDVIAPVEPSPPILPDLAEGADPEPALDPDFIPEEILPQPAPLSTPDPTELLIDDLSPIDDRIVSPLDDVVGLAPIVEPEDEISAQEIILPAEVIPEEVQPGPLIELPEDVVVLPDPDTEVQESVEPAIAEEEGPTDIDEQTTDPEVAADTGGSSLIDDPTPAMQLIAQLLRQIRATPAPACTMALPRTAGSDDAGLALVGADAGAMDNYAAEITNGLSFDVAQSRELLAPAQCALINMIRQIDSYPATRLGLAVDDTTLASGENLRATITGAGGLFLTLLIVDDRGVVQDLARFTTIAGNTAIIDVPVARAGELRTTRQALVAIGTAGTPLDLNASIGGLADDVLTGLTSDILADAVFGLVAIDVR